MHAAPGVGLASPQIGVSLQIIVIDMSVGENPDSVMVLINPEIVSHSGKTVVEEGCLSLPGVASEVPRYEKVVVRGKDRHGKLVEIEAEGLLARALQHEIDHLSGSLYWDRIGKIKREHLRKKYKKSMSNKGS
jgi:peptide deformylase